MTKPMSERDIDQWGLQEIVLRKSQKFSQSVKVLYATA